ncbi:hypothetical protein EYE40_00815 [Glaciihabitans arcticus]|uniref:Uncharacterized protein n=1 Tax=Glaciihabitans arcticus TaxID=2668039 RepID=A0A4Q9GQ24_9MICO|nr:hypothetical protein [Glaciihabitans arcticus]TBN56054.1 hypothetical protein EYE40_00815 [Glaciihabitans arcticus]
MTDETVEAKKRFGWLTIAVIVLFGLLYAYDVWEAIGNLLQFPQVYVDQADVPWWLLIANLALPVLLFGLALWLGWKRSFIDKVLLFFVGLSVVAVLTFDIYRFILFV